MLARATYDKSHTYILHVYCILVQCTYVYLTAHEHIIKKSTKAKRTCINKASVYRNKIGMEARYIVQSCMNLNIIRYMYICRKRFVLLPAASRRRPQQQQQQEQSPSRRGRCSRSPWTWPFPGAAYRSSAPTFSSSPSSSPSGSLCPTPGARNVSGEEKDHLIKHLFCSS